MTDRSGGLLAGARGIGRFSLLLPYDLVATAVAVAAALVVRFDSTDPTVSIYPYLPAALIPILIRPAVFITFGLYRREWRHASVRDLRDLLGAVAVGSVIGLIVFGVVMLTTEPKPFPRSFFILEPLFSVALIAGMRLVLRTALEHRATSADQVDPPIRTLVYGAGNAGAAIGRMTASGAIPGVKVVGYLDDDPKKRGSRLLGGRVFGPLDELPAAVRASRATQLLIAIPSGAGSPFRRAATAARELQLAVKTVPPLRDLVTGGYRVSGIRALSVEDLLRRDSVEIDTEEIAASINGASVLVTGGGGSIGGELVRQILTLGPRLLTIVEHHEWTLWNVEREIATRHQESDGAQIVAALADVRSAPSMSSVLQRSRPDIVFHAAALKHVPYVEMYPAEGVLTNVVGTQNVLRACEQLDVRKFVLISTDKAVEPVSVMGQTKRLAEQLTVAAGHRTGRPYAAVRFGNVLGSSGSIVPLLQRQLDDGLPLTITQPDATRYFMTISEAVSLILQAGTKPEPGDLYVLDMGDPIRILDLAHDLVRLNGLDPDTINFTITGLRPGERLHEKLFYDDETPERTHHPRILRASRPASSATEAQIEALVEDLTALAVQQDDDRLRQMLARSRGAIDVVTG
ncbi:MAG: polysaccharide biosynthesis protein [Chloroflexi bacterium]|nr:polysaccharide biosynthesis protein [Chloroflexota bacterium]